MVAKFLDHNNRELKQRRRRRQREELKSNKFLLANQQLCTCITLFCTFHCATVTWNLLISRACVNGVETQHKMFLFFFSKNLAKIWQIKWNWIRSIKFETVRIHFLSEFTVCCHPEILLPWQRDVTTNSDFTKSSQIPKSKFLSNWETCFLHITADNFLGGFVVGNFQLCS